MDLQKPRGSEDPFKGTDKVSGNAIQYSIAFLLTVSIRTARIKPDFRQTIQKPANASWKQARTGGFALTLKLEGIRLIETNGEALHDET